MPEFPEYDPAIAEAAMAFVDEQGLPGFLGVEVVEAGPGSMRCAMEVRPELLNLFGMLHGGVVSTLVDHVLAAVCYPVIPRGAWAATTEFKINLVAPVRDGMLFADAEIVAMSKRTAVVRVEVRNPDEVVALAQGTLSIQPPRPGGPGA